MERALHAVKIIEQSWYGGDIIKFEFRLLSYRSLISKVSNPNYGGI